MFIRKVKTELNATHPSPGTAAGAPAVHLHAVRGAGYRDCVGARERYVLKKVLTEWPTMLREPYANDNALGQKEIGLRSMSQKCPRETHSSRLAEHRGIALIDEHAKPCDSRQLIVRIHDIRDA